MKKNLQGIATGLILGFILSTFVLAEPITEMISVVFDNYRVIINGSDKTYTEDMKPLNYNGRVYVPLRYIGEALNMDVSWEGATKTIILDEKKDLTVTLKSKTDLTQEQLNTSMYIIRGRLISAGVTTLQTELSDNQIVLHASSKELTDEILYGCITPGILTLQDADGKTILSNQHITAAFPCYDDLVQTGSAQHYVEICLTEEGRQLFAAETERISALPNDNNYIAIYVDERLYSLPFVQNKIDTTRIMISGYFTEESVKSLAAVLSAEPLPALFEIIK